MNKTFLIEIGTEELPAKSLRTIAESWKNNVIAELVKHRVKYDEILWFATPRRIAIKIEKVHITIKKHKKRYKGPSIPKAFDHLGNLTQATQCWMKKLKIEINQTFRIQEKTREWLCYEHFIESQTIEQILAETSISSIKNISIPNSMKWNTNNAQFSRPIRNIIMLLDKNLIQKKILGLQTNRLLFGHIFMKKNIINIPHANTYPKILLQHGKVIADYTVRKNKIIKESQKIVDSIGGYLNIKDSLLEEITSLVEWPVMLLSNFDEKFLNLPHEILIYIIENQQKHFAVYDLNSKKLTNNFIVISNIESTCPKNIIVGNKKILNSRFFDAQFFFKKDRKISLNEYQPLLKKVIFQNSLGSLYEKVNRMKKLISWITQFTKANLNDCLRATHLCKCDLITDMVFEFPEMQGTIGMYYALYDGEPKNVAKAIKKHYSPKFSKDIIPSNSIAYSLSLVDKVDTLVGLFIIKKNSTSGDKDPFSLRRLAIGIIRIILTKKISIDLLKLLKKSLNTYNFINERNNIIQTLKKFILEKLYFIYVKQKYNSSIIKSVLACDITNLIDLDLRIQTITNMYNSNIFKSLIILYKRISNILTSSKEILYDRINDAFLTEIEEQNTVSLLKYIEKKIQNFYLKRDYKSILFELYNLNEPVYNFFKKIKIKDKNISIKINRLTILKNIQNLFLKITDFSYLC